MSTRCTINFMYEDQIVAKVYRHCDGYPDGDTGVLADLERFYDAVEAQTKDHRYSDPSFLAAKFVVWQAKRYAHSYNPVTQEWGPSPTLDFLSVGIVQENPGDIAYEYFVYCVDAQRPMMSYKKVRKWNEAI